MSEPAMIEMLRKALVEARRWIGDGDLSDGMHRDIWTPRYRAAVDMVDGALSASQPVAVLAQAEPDAHDARGTTATQGMSEPRGLDSVRLTDSDSVRDGLEAMLTAAIGEHGYGLGFVEPGLALLVIEAAKRAEDREDWFPHGKWATVQAMQERTERELQWLFAASCAHRWKVTHEGVTWHDCRCELCGVTKRETWD
jgi:hypothetical protein